MDYASTTDLLCSPGKYIEDTYKLGKIYSSFGNTWSGFSDLPKEFVGMTLNGSFLAQALQTDGGDLDSIYPTSGTMQDMDQCGTLSDFYNTHANLNQPKRRYLVNKILPGCLFKTDDLKNEQEIQCGGPCLEKPFDVMNIGGGFKYNYQGLQVIGIAFDGHAIYGPYNED